MWLRIALGLAALTLCTSAFAMRCGEHVVWKGFLPIDVIDRCGEPVYVRSWTEYYGHQPVRHVDEWVYEFGRQRFRRLLRFENGRLTRITTERKPKHLNRSARVAAQR